MLFCKKGQFDLDKGGGEEKYPAVASAYSSKEGERKQDNTA